jgi:hypothetical protein
MINTKEILDALKELYNSGATYIEIGEKLGVSKSYVHSLLTGARAIDGLTVRKINQLFPNAVLHINGDKVNINASNNSGNVVGINHGRISNNKDITEAILNEVMDSEKLSAEAKVEVFNIVKKINKG